MTKKMLISPRAVQYAEQESLSQSIRPHLESEIFSSTKPLIHTHEVSACGNNDSSNQPVIVHFCSHTNLTEGFYHSWCWYKARAGVVVTATVRSKRETHRGLVFLARRFQYPPTWCWFKASAEAWRIYSGAVNKPQQSKFPLPRVPELDINDNLMGNRWESALFSSR